MQNCRKYKDYFNAAINRIVIVRSQKRKISKIIRYVYYTESKN